MLFVFLVNTIPLQAQMIVEVMADQPEIFEVTVTGDMFILTDTSLILGAGYIFSGGKEPYQYTWMMDDEPLGYEPVLEIPLPEGDRVFRLLVHDANNCTETVIITHDFTVSADMAPTVPGKFTIYPVPASSHITIKPHRGEDIFDVSIFNMQGALILKRQISGETLLEIDFPPGIYNVLVEDRNGNVAGTRKIIVL